MIRAYTRKRGLQRTVIQRRAKKGRKGQKRKKYEKKGMKNKTKKFKHANRAPAESRRDNVSFCWHNQSYRIIRLGDGPTEKPHDKTRRKTRNNEKDKNRERKEQKRPSTQSSKNQTRIYMSSWWCKDDTRDPKGRQGKKGKDDTNNHKEKNKHH